MKIAYFHSYFYKGIILKIRVRNTPFSAFTILLVKKLGIFLIPDYYQNLEIIPEPTISIFHSIYLRYFLRGFSKNINFHPYFYKGIVLKNRGQNQSL